MRGTNSIELITKEFTKGKALRSRRREELPNDFLPGNCPAVNLPVPVIFRKVIRGSRFQIFRSCLNHRLQAIDHREKSHPLPFLYELFLSHAFSLLSPDPSVLTAISHPSVRLDAKLVPEAATLYRRKSRTSGWWKERQRKKG